MTALLEPALQADKFVEPPFHHCRLKNQLRFLRVSLFLQLVYSVVLQNLYLVIANLSYWLLSTWAKTYLDRIKNVRWSASVSNQLRLRYTNVYEESAVGWHVGGDLRIERTVQIGRLCSITESKDNQIMLLKIQVLGVLWQVPYFTVVY